MLVSEIRLPVLWSEIRLPLPTLPRVIGLCGELRGLGNLAWPMLVPSTGKRLAGLLLAGEPGLLVPFGGVAITGRQSAG